MKKILLIVNITFLFFFYSCETKKQRQDRFVETKIQEDSLVISLSPPMQKGEINIDKIALIDSIVILETNNEALIGAIDDIIFDDNLIFIGDRHKTATLFIFSEDGKFQAKINAIGQAPNEYISFDGFDIDKKNNIIYILDGSRGTILLWNYRGEYIGLINLPFKNIDSFVHLKDNVFYFNFGFRQDDYNKLSPHNLILYDADTDKTITSFFPFDFQLFPLRLLDNSLFSKDKDEIYYRTLLGNHIYKLEKDSLSIVIKCDLGIFQTPFDCYFLTNKAFKKVQKERGYATLGRFYNFNEWIYLGINRSQMGAHYFYNKNEKRGYLNLSHILPNSKFIPPNIFQYNENLFCGWIMPEQIRFFDENSKYAFISEDDNPILIFFKLK